MRSTLRSAIPTRKIAKSSLSPESKYTCLLSADHTTAPMFCFTRSTHLPVPNSYNRNRFVPCVELARYLLSGEHFGKKSPSDSGITWKVFALRLTMTVLAVSLADSVSTTDSPAWHHRTEPMLDSCS